MYYNDNNLNSNESNELNTFIEETKDYLSKMGIENTNYFFTRNKDGESTLGIQLKEGNPDEMENYILYNNVTSFINSKIFLNVEFKSSSKIMDKAMEFNMNAKKEVQKFFYMIELKIMRKEIKSEELNYSKNVHIEKANVLKRLFKKKNK